MPLLAKVFRYNSTEIEKKKRKRCKIERDFTQLDQVVVINEVENRKRQ